MSLFNLVEQDHLIGPAPHCFGQRPALVIANIARRGPDHPADRVLFHILAHVQAGDGRLVVEQELGERLGQLGLANPRGTQEQERADGSRGVFQTCARAPHSIGDRDQGFLLADDTTTQGVFHRQQLFTLAFQHLLDRHPGPAADDPGDLLGINHLWAERVLRRGSFFLCQLALQLGDLAIGDLGRPLQVPCPLGRDQFGAQAVQGLADLGGLTDLVLFRTPLGRHILRLGFKIDEFVLKLFQPLPGRGIGFLGQGLAFNLQLHDPAVDFVKGFGLGIDRHPHPTASLVHQVDGLVGEKPVGDVAIGQGRGGHDGAVGNPHPVVDFVFFLQAAQDRDGVFDRGFADKDRLEPAGQSRVFLNVLAVLIQCRGAHAMQLAPRQSRFQQV